MAQVVDDDHHHIDASELWPPMGLLFITSLNNTHGELVDDVDWGKHLIHPLSTLAVSPAELSSSKSGGSGQRK
jgi:hypothetical protein